jgi:hypothetical protein
MQPSPIFLMILAALSAAPALADKLPLPKAAYSADVVFESKGKEYGGHVNVDGVKERLDIKDPNGITALRIIRRDTGKVYDLRPKRHLAVVMRIAAAEAAGETGAPGVDVDSFYGVEVTPQGTETISGLLTTKYSIKVDAEQKGGLAVDASVWTTDDGIVVRAIGKTSIEADIPPDRMELRNISRGPQEATLFELPPGMSILPLGGDSDTPEPPGSLDAAQAQPAGQAATK